MTLWPSIVPSPAQGWITASLWDAIDRKSCVLLYNNAYFSYSDAVHANTGVWSSGWFDLDPGWGYGVMEYGVQGGLTLTLGEDVGLWSMEFRVVWIDPGWGCGVMEYGVQGGLTLTLGEDVRLWSMEFIYHLGMSGSWQVVGTFWTPKKSISKQQGFSEQWPLSLFIFQAPLDKNRLVFPVVPAVGFAILFYCIYLALWPRAVGQCLFAGTILGYVAYDLTHYFLHHGVMHLDYFKRLKKYHVKHHFEDQNHGRSCQRKTNIYFPFWID